MTNFATHLAAAAAGAADQPAVRLDATTLSYARRLTNPVPTTHASSKRNPRTP